YDRMLSERPEAGSHFCREQLRLLPGGEMAACLQPVVVHELWIRALRPAPRRLVELIGEHAYCNGNGHSLRGEEGQLTLPIKTSRRNAGVGQPVERHIVEDVRLGDTPGLTIECARDEGVTAGVVIQHPRR